VSENEITRCMMNSGRRMIALLEVHLLI
jgi:hypothetical protein